MKEAIITPGVSRRSAAVFLAALVSSLLPRVSRAISLPRPAGKPILTLSGKISYFNQGDRALFDRPMLEALGVSSLRTRTPWSDSEVRFDGVPMIKLMQTVGAFGDRVRAIALNDYVTEIPLSDFARYGVLLAMKRNGKYMSIRERGPLFIIYPFDAFDELWSSTYSSRCAWQVAQLIVK